MIWKVDLPRRTDVKGTGVGDTNPSVFIATSQFREQKQFKCVSSTYAERSKDFGTTCSSLNLRYSFLPLCERQIEIIGRRRHADIEGYTDDNGYIGGSKVIRRNPLTFQVRIPFWLVHQVNHERYPSSPSRLTSFVFFFFPMFFSAPPSPAGIRPPSSRWCTFSRGTEYLPHGENI